MSDLSAGRLANTEGTLYLPVRMRAAVVQSRSLAGWLKELDHKEGAGIHGEIRKSHRPES
jgi:hypothetical protein